MINKTISLIILLLFQAFSYADGEPLVKHPVYIGALGGYGSTTWDGLVPTLPNQNTAMRSSTPIEVKEGGTVWGLLLGYEFSPAFAFEASYIKYEDADVSFDSEWSIFTFNNNGLDAFKTDTKTISLMGKIMLPLFDNKVRPYSSAGAAILYRKDMLLEDTRFTPTFGLGVNFIMSERLMGEIAGNYVAGYGESQLNPANTFFPFIYSVSYRIAYRF